MLENVVFLELKRRGLELYYHRDKQECDFIITENERATTAIQVSLTLNNNKDREFRALLEAMDTYRMDSGLILTEAEEFEENIQGKKVVVKPIWKWLLE